MNLKKGAHDRRETTEKNFSCPSTRLWTHQTAAAQRPCIPRRFRRSLLRPTGAVNRQAPAAGNRWQRLLCGRRVQCSRCAGSNWTVLSRETSHSGQPIYSTRSRLIFCISICSLITSLPCIFNYFVTAFFIPQTWIYNVAQKSMPLSSIIIKSY